MFRPRPPFAAPCVPLAVLVIVTVVAAAAVAAPARAGDAAPGLRATVVSDDGRRIVLDVELLSYRLDAVRIDGADHVVPVIPGEAVGLDEGAPALPHAARSVSVPGDADWLVTARPTSFHDIAVAVAPSKGNLSRRVDPASVPYRFGAAYRAAGFAPAALATAGATYVLRDLHGVALRFNPFQYDPSARVLRVVERMTVELTAAGPLRTLVAPRAGRGRTRVAAFEALYRDHFINYAPGSALAYPHPDEQGELLVIAHDAFLPNLQPLVEHKAGIGLTVRTVGISTIGNDPVSIRNYIQNAYDTRDLAFVLLVGDAAQVATTARQVGGENGACDVCYGKTAGADHYPDVLVGRFAAASAAHVDTMVARTVTYETLPAAQQDWYHRGTGIASGEGAGQGDEGQSDIQHEDEIRGWLLGAGYTLVDRTYDPGATDTMVANALNAGRGVVNYTGHGSPTSWGTTGFNNGDVDALVNKDKLPFVYSVACNNGEFHHYDACFGEAWTRASKDGVPTGAVATNMSSVSQSWAPPMEAQDEFNLRLTDATVPYRTFGGLVTAGSASMIDAYGGGGVEMSDTWILFGDPSVQVLGSPQPSHGLKVTPAEGLVASGPVGGPFAPSSRVYTLQNLDDTPLVYDVSTAAPWLTVTAGHGTIGARESVSVNVALNGEARNLDIGTSAASVTFTNLTDHSGDTTRAASVRASGEVAARVFALDADPGWARQGEWQFGRPAGKGGGMGGNPDPTSGCTGTNVFGVNLEGNFSTLPGGPYRLTAGPFDLSAVTGATLRFDRWLNIIGAPYVSASVEASNNGVNWTTLWSATTQVADAAWTPLEYDISGIADGRPGVWLRWSYAVLRNVAVGTSGWNIDDIEIWGQPSTARVALDVRAARLEWAAVPGVAAYDVVQGDAGTLLASGGDFAAATLACLADNVTATGLDVAGRPADGGALWYLVRAAGVGSALTYGDVAPGQVASRDAGIAASAHACP
jgi:hypothetical protein